MKTVLSVNEFAAYMTEHKPSKVSFWTENQPRHKSSVTCRVRMVFPIMLILENPNVICLKHGDGNEMYFYSVKYIKMDDESSVLGTIITVYCGGLTPNDAETSYTLVAS